MKPMRSDICPNDQEHASDLVQSAQNVIVSTSWCTITSFFLAPPTFHGHLSWREKWNLWIFYQEISGEKSLKTMDALHAPAMLKYWWALIEIIRWGCTWQRTMATPVTPLPAAVQRGISAGWFFITDPISACTSALFSQVCVPAEWRWARVKITLHIHLPNWLLNAATGGWGGAGRKKDLLIY